MHIASNDGMKQQDLGLDLSTRRTRKQILLDEMDLVMPWGELLALIAPHAPVAKTGRPPFDLAMMLRIHCLQQWFGLSDLGAEEALFETSFLRDFVGISGTERIPDRVSVLRFRHLLEEHELSPKILAVINAKLAAHGLLLKTGTVVDATLIAAPSSTKNKTGERDPEMHQAKKGNQWYFGMKAHIGVDSATKVIHAVVATAANVADCTVLPDLLHGDETRVWGDQAYRGQREAIRKAAPAARDFTNRRCRHRGVVDEVEKAKNRTKSRVRAKVEHPFLVIKRVFGFTRLRYRGLQKNAHRLFVTCALANLFMLRYRLA
jgi:IS5 family transposase